MSRGSPKTSSLAGAVLLLGSCMVGLLVAELGFRLLRHSLTDTSNALTKSWMFVPDRLKKGYPENTDSRLGWVPKSNLVTIDPHSKGNITLLGNGVRYTGELAAAEVKPGVILTVGDSFTFGDQVGDLESWPAILQRLTGKKVINAGVSGYGIDQAILRAEQLLSIYHPDTIVLSFIADDIKRCGFEKAWGLPKPYFALGAGDSLELKNQPLPPFQEAKPKLGPMRGLLGYSHLLSALFSKLIPAYWHSGLGYVTATAHDDAPEVACRLMDRLAALTREHGTRLLTVALYEFNVLPEESEANEKVLACARAKGLRTLNTYGQLAAIRKDDAAELKTLFDWHMTAKGNALVAKWIAGELSTGAAIPARSTSSKERGKP